jgi:PAS domain S-box-containing protein
LAENADVQTRGLDDAAELLQSLPDPVIGCDADGTVVYWSRAAEEAYGYLATEARGRRAAALLHTRFPAPLLEITEELADLGRWQGRLEHRRKDGRTVSVESRWVARRDPAGRWVGSVAIERALGGEAGPSTPDPAPAGAPEEPERRLVHDINNALAVIVNYTAFVATELESTDDVPAGAGREKMRADISEIQTAADRAVELSRRLLG